MQALLSSAREQASSQAHAETSAPRNAPDFAYIVSHDLATEFRHVAEFAKILRDELPDEIGQSAATSLHFLSDAAERCQAMLSEVRIYSRVQRKHLTPSRYNAQELVDEAILQLSRQINETHAVIDCAVADEVFVDAGLFVEALRRLIANAIQFSPRDAVVRVEIAGGQETDEAWRLRIRDYGCGLDPRYRAEAFGMFWQLDRNAAPEHVGAGLPIALEIVRRHGGEIEFVDCERGACVEVALPRWSEMALDWRAMSFGQPS